MENPELFFPELSPIENNLLEKNYSVDDGEAVLVISLDLGDGRSDQIKVYEHDDSDQLALDFCHKHKLGSRAKMLLAGEIEKNLKVALSRAVALSTSYSSTQSYSSRPRRNQNSTQRAMQSKQAVCSPYLSPLKSSTFEPARAGPALKRQNTSMVYQSSAQGPKVRGNKRANSMYEKPRKAWTETQSPVNLSVVVTKKNEEKSEKSERSERLMKKIKYQRYKEIFNALCPGTKEVITAESICGSSVSQNVRKIIKPLLDELQELRETLDFNEFYDAMEMLMKVLTPGDKSSLLLPGKSKPGTEEKFKFKPKTNVARQMNGNMSTSSLYDRALQKKQEFSRKIEREKESMIEEEMKECRFAPSIKHKRSLSTKSFWN